MTGSTNDNSKLNKEDNFDYLNWKHRTQRVIPGEVPRVGFL
jgi:hypothetical protein